MWGELLSVEASPVEVIRYQFWEVKRDTCKWKRAASNLLDPKADWGLFGKDDGWERERI